MCPEFGHKPRFLARDGQKLRWCPENGAGTKKLSTDGQKMRWCPETGAGTKKLSTDGQKLRWCPETGAGAKKLTTADPNRQAISSSGVFLTFRHSHQVVVCTWNPISARLPPTGSVSARRALEMENHPNWCMRKLPAAVSFPALQPKCCHKTILV
ncbi:MAG: hypothetical protein QM296_12850 [Bacillota bacterium]|nr:hypothetical protein [Bacillota bacterium]